MNSEWGTPVLLFVAHPGFQSNRRSLNIHSTHGPVVNPYQHPASAVPWDTRERRSAGGSSGGSAAAVAAGMCDV